MATQSELLFKALDMDGADQVTLETALSRRYQDAYVDSLQQQLDRLGIRQSAKAASGAELRDLEGFASADAESITNTYNSDLQRKIDSLDLTLPLDTLKTELRAWRTDRAQWKNIQISKAVRGKASNYANAKFIEKNSLQQAKIIWYAQPPIVINSHKLCIERVRQGAVDWDIAQDWELVHVGCRHTKQILLQSLGGLKGRLWTG